MTIKDQLTVVPSNTMVVDPQELRNVPLKLGENVYVRDVGTVSRRDGYPGRIRARQRPQVGLPAGGEAGLGLDAFGRECGQGEPGAVPGSAA